MLFTDATFITVNDLAAVDGEVAKVAQVLGITVDSTPTVVGITTQAVQECGADLQGKMQTFGGYPTIGGVGWSQNAAVLQTGTAYGIDRPRVFLTQIVLDSQYAGFQSPVQRWAVYRALYLFYASAFGRKLEDRFATKRDFYDKEYSGYFNRQFYPNGLPFLTSPLSCPGAVHEYGSGPWSQSNITAVTGSGPVAPTIYYVAITYVDGTRYVSPTTTGNAESGQSAIVQSPSIDSAQVINVSITGLNAPNGTSRTGISQGILPRLAASGWNVYVGTTATALYLQNSTPIPIATKNYALAGVPTTTGALLGTGQYPDANLTFRKMVQRG